MKNSVIPVSSLPVVGAAEQRVDVTVPVGSSVADMIAIAMPQLPQEQYGALRVSLVNERGEMLVSRAYWHVTKPRAGARVVIRIVPGKNALRSVLMIVVAVGAMIIGQYWLTPMLLEAGWGSVAAGIAGSLFSAGLTVAGALLINALIPPASVKSQERDRSYQLSGWRNRVPSSDDVLPCLFGKVRYAPPFAATSYTEIVGDDQYIRALFTFGYGPVLLDDFRIGDTSLSNYDEVEIEVREGRAGDLPVSLFPRQVLEDPVSVTLERPYPRNDNGDVQSSEDTIETPVVRPTALHSTHASVILAFQGGLFSVNDSGNYLPLTVEIRIRQRLYGATDWTDVETLKLTAKKSAPFFRQHTWKLPTRGRYEIEVTRMTDERTSTRLSDDCTFAGLQSIRPEYPINFDKPLALVALRIKATHQLSGALDDFNALAQREMPVYNGADWVAGAGSNPASAYLVALQGNHNPFPIADSEIDFDVIADWYAFCETKGLKFDYCVDRAMSFRDMLLAVCAAGRASPRHTGKQWSVVIDRPDDVVIDHISPRNSSDFRWSRSYFKPPDALRVTFQDSTNNYETAERLIPWIGFTGTPDVTEDLELVGKVDPDEIFIEAMRYMFVLKYRPDSYSAVQSGVARVATRGDLVMGSYDVLSHTQTSARVLSVSGSLVELDELIAMEEGKEYGIRYRVYENEQDAVGQSVVSKVRTQTGEQRTVTLKENETIPVVGELIHFGPLANVSTPLKVKGVEPGKDFSGVLHFVDAAPIIDEETDALVPPAWSGIVGDEAASAVILPATPRITSVASGVAETGSADGLTVLVVAGTGSTALLSTFEIDHKLSSDTDWTTLSVPVANGGADIEGQTFGAEVELRVRAVASDGTAGPYTSVVTVVIGSNDPVLPEALDVNLITVTGGLGNAVASLTTTADEATELLQLYRVPAGDELNRELHFVGAPVATAPNSSANLLDGDSTRTTLLSNGAFNSVDAWVLGNGWSIASGKAEHASGAAGNIDQSIGFTSGKYYRLGFVVDSMTAGTIKPLISGGSDRVGTEIDSDGSYLDRLQAVTGNDLFSLVANADFDGAVDDVVLFEETGACVDQGTYDYYIEPQNADGNPGPVSGPFTVTIT